MAPSSILGIAHLSDLHLTASDDDARSEPKLFGQLTGMNAAFRKLVRCPQVQHADLVLVTGDVTDRGDPEAWNVFWTTIRETGLHDRTRVVPGNHDVCQLGFRPSFADSRGDALAKMVGGLYMGQHHPRTFPWEWLSPDRRTIILGLNSNNMGNRWVGDNAIGKVDYHQLSALAGMLRKYRHIPVKVVALHHSPNIPGESTARRRGYKGLTKNQRRFLEMRETDRRALRLICMAGGVRLILHGHVHMEEDRRLNRARVCGARASTQPVNRRHRQPTYRFCSYRVIGTAPQVRRAVHTVSL